MTTENNKLIAEFMEHKPTFEVYIDDVLTTLERPIKNYNSDWNWLMGVVGKIESIDDCGIDIFFGCVEIYKDGITIIKVSAKHKNKIEAVYNACVEFIKWYNENGAKNN